MQEIVEVPTADTILIQMNGQRAWSTYICKHIMESSPLPKKFKSEEEYLKTKKPTIMLCIPQVQKDALLRLPLGLPAKKFWTQIT